MRLSRAPRASRICTCVESLPHFVPHPLSESVIVRPGQGAIECLCASASMLKLLGNHRTKGIRVGINNENEKVTGSNDFVYLMTHVTREICRIDICEVYGSVVYSRSRMGLVTAFILPCKSNISRGGTPYNLVNSSTNNRPRFIIERCGRPLPLVQTEEPRRG